MLFCQSPPAVASPLRTLLALVAAAALAWQRRAQRAQRALEAALSTLATLSTLSVASLLVHSFRLLRLAPGPEARQVLGQVAALALRRAEQAFWKLLLALALVAAPALLPRLASSATSVLLQALASFQALEASSPHHLRQEASASGI